MGGSRLRANGRCVFAMLVGSAVPFQEYWEDPAYRDKRPVRNGSRKMLVGDNIYHRNARTGDWQQEDSHHSNPDGSINRHNLVHDTRVDRVLISERYIYFGSEAPIVPPTLLRQMNYRNPRDYRVFDRSMSAPLIDWIMLTYPTSMNCVLGDPFDFDHSAKRYSAQDDRLK